MQRGLCYAKGVLGSEIQAMLRHLYRCFPATSAGGIKLKMAALAETSLDKPSDRPPLNLAAVCGAASRRRCRQHFLWATGNFESVSGCCVTKCCTGFVTAPPVLALPTTSLTNSSSVATGGACPSCNVGICMQACQPCALIGHRCTLHHWCNPHPHLAISA